jgi:hypothetical protein
MADSLDDAKAAFRAAWEAIVRFRLETADKKCSGRVILLMTPCRREPGGQNDRNSAAQVATAVP